MFLHKKTIFQLYHAALQAGTAFFCCRQKKQVLFFGLLACFISSIAQVQSPKFTRLTTNEGLSQGHVSAILKDKKGFMWFATDGGLNKYDGYSFTIYKNDHQNATSISNDIVSDIMEDAAGNIWAATRSGLDRFDRNKGEFIHYHPGSHNIVNDIFQDSRKRIWAGTSDGLYVLNPASGLFKSYKHDKSDTNSLRDNFVYKITEDNYGDIWIGTQNGLNRFNPSTQRFSCYSNSPLRSTNIGADQIVTIYKDVKGNIWAGTIGNGIALFNRQKNTFTNFLHNPGNVNSISHNDIISICEDDKENLWIGTENGGISVFDYKAHTFYNYKNDPYNANSLGNNSVTSLYKDDLGTMWVGTYSEGVNMLPENGDKFTHYNVNLASNNSLNERSILSIIGDTDNLWIGTDGGGLNKFDKSTKTFTHFKNNINNKNSINSNYVTSVIQLDKNLLGLGLYQGGFDLFDIKTGKFTHHLPEKSNPASISLASVSSLCKSNDGSIWIGTWGGGLNLFRRRTNSFTHFQNNPNKPGSIVSNSINCMYEDKDGNLWIGTDDGLDRLDKGANSFIHYRHTDANPKSLSHNFVQFIFNDHKNNLWIGTAGGLNLLNRKNQTFTIYTEKEGLANNMIQSIIEDTHDNLWLASNNGLTKFNPLTKSVRNYTISDGLQGKEFKPGSCFKYQDGQMLFGGTNGFNVFYPDSLKDNNFIPPVYLTHFQIFNKEVLLGGKGSPLQQQISEANEITLSYSQSVISFEFAALNFNLSQKNQYAYKLEGFDKEWIYTGNKRTATYTNLDPGTYILHVKGSNNDGVWNEKGTSVTITILPPFWLTWWFKLGILLLVIGSAAWFYHFRMNIVRRQKLTLEQKVYEQTLQLISSNEEERKARQEADQANSAKSVFLATMSHEIRTPMNGVIGMASLLMQTGLNEEQHNYAKIISTCGENLLAVINGILDFSKIESGKMELENKLFNLKTCVEEVLEIFSFKASEAEIKLGYKIAGDVPAYITGDCLRLRQVLINLVANALKFTNQGEVFINIYTNPQVSNANLVVYFEVHDTGIGISAHKLERLFKAFTQVDSSTTRKYGGTGLGLVICEKLVALMGGNIKVASELDKGSTFTFNIQTTATKLPPDQNSGLSPANSKNTTFKKHVLSANFSALHPMQILIAEDNAVNAIIITKILSKLGYSTSTAANGQEVLTMLNHDNYDLILMDMQMPEMDGLEATSIIRKCCDNQPVIIAMTANAMEDDREKCIEAGMDDYLSKPINLDTLMSMLAKWNDKIKIAPQEVTDAG